MNVSELQIQLLRLQEDGLRIQQLIQQYTFMNLRFTASSIPRYESWINNLYQYENRYLSGHRIHPQFQSGFSASSNPVVAVAQLLRCLDIVNQDKMFWEDLKQKGLFELEGTGIGGLQAGEAAHIHSTLRRDRPTVFLSYNWGSDKTADEVERRLKPIAEVLRDKSSMGPWAGITEFMKNIRTTDLVVIIVSDAYLKSVACLYEIMQLLKDDNWISHTMFLVEDSAKGIYKPLDQLEYVKYWVKERDNLKKALAGIDHALVTAQAEELKKIDLIQRNVNDFMRSVADRNNPDMSQAIDAVERRVRASLGPM